MNLYQTKTFLLTNAIPNKTQVANEKLMNHSKFLSDMAKTMCRLNCEPSDSVADNRLKTHDNCSKTTILN